MDLVDISPDDPRLASDLLPVLVQLRPHLTQASLASIYAEGHPQGLRFLAAYDPSGRCVGVAGWRLLAKTHSGREVYVDDLVVADDARSGGVGAALLDELSVRARAAGCATLSLDSGVQRNAAHRFYLRERFDITSFHFNRRV